MKDEICQIIRSNRPNISEGSIKTYCSILNSLYKKLEGVHGVDFFFNEPEKIIAHIEKMEKDQSKKTLLSSLFVLTKNEKYREPMLKFANQVNQKYKEKKTDPERLKNMPTMEQLREIYNTYENNLKKNPTAENYVNYFIVAVTSGVIMNPRRLKDWSEMKHKNYNVKTENFMTAKDFYFNVFKTAKFTKEEDKRVPIPKEMMSHLRKWKKINESDYFLINNKGEKFDTTNLNKRLNTIYGDRIGVSALRSISWTAKTPEIEQFEKLKSKLEDKAKKMGHSLDTALSVYVKKD
jgi:hypothetical protein